MYLKGLLQLGCDRVKAPCLDARRCLKCVAMHRIAAPQNRVAGLLNGGNQWWQARINSLNAQAMNQRDAARFPIRVQHFQQIDSTRPRISGRRP